MEIFINEVSLQGQYQSEEEFVNAVKVFRSIFSQLLKNRNKKAVFKDSTYLFNFNAIKDKNFLSALRMLKDQSLRQAFRQLVFNNANAKEWRAERIHNVNDWFICSIYTENDGLVTDNSMAEIAERNLQNPEQQRLLVNFISSCFSEEQTVTIVKNENEPIPVNCIETLEELQRWLTKYFPFDPEAFLKNTERFQETKYINQGRTIFQEKNTGYYWYLDNLHKQFENSYHFEVFDKQGNHLGIADIIYGKIDKTKKVKGRTVLYELYFCKHLYTYMALTVMPLPHPS